MSNDDIISTNKKLKAQLSEISKQIEEAIEKHKMNKEQPKIYDNNVDEEDIKKSNEFQSQIGKYKNKIDDINNQLQNNNTYVKAIKDEDEIKDLQRHLVELKKEYDTLMKIKKNQEIGLKELDKKYNSKTELVGVSQKLKNLKDEYKIMKDYNKNLIDKLNKQNKEIIKLQDQCKLIKDNIDAKKNAPETNENIEDEINQLNIQIQQNQKLLKNQERNYLNNINKQNDKINKLDEELNIIKIQIYHKKQEQKINLLKYRELEKLTNEIQQKKIEREEKLRREQSKKLYQSYNPTYSQNKVQNFNDYIKQRQPPFKIPKFNTSPSENRYNTNNYSSYNYTSGNNNYNINNYNSYDLQKRGEVMKDIENLRNDIQFALKNDNNFDEIELNQNINNDDTNNKDFTSNIIDKKTPLIPTEDENDINENKENDNNNINENENNENENDENNENNGEENNNKNEEENKIQNNQINNDELLDENQNENVENVNNENENENKEDYKKSRPFDPFTFPGEKNEEEEDDN